MGFQTCRERDGIPFSGRRPNSPNPTIADSDSDGLSDGLESVLETNPMDPDSDQDGLTDWARSHRHAVVTIGVETEVIVRSNPSVQRQRR